jgi:hypothetical protein
MLESFHVALQVSSIEVFLAAAWLEVDNVTRQ